MAQANGAGGPSGADRRQFERVPGRVEVRFARADQAARALRAYSLNFSVGGLCLKTQKRYEVGDRLMLYLTVEGYDITVRGAVAWTRPGVAVGIRFEDVNEADRLRLEQLVASLKNGK